MQKKFLSNLALMVILNLLVKPIAIFGIDATVQNRVGAEDYGLYFSLLNFSFLFNILLDFGINNFTTKNVAQYPDIALKYLGKILSFRLVLFFFYLVFSYSIALLLNWNSHELYLLSFLFLNQFFITILAYVRSHFGGLMLFRVEAFLSVLDRLILIIICGVLLYFPVSDIPFKIEWFIWIQTICYGVALLIGLILLFSKIGMPKLKYRPVFSYAIIRKSFPYALLILLMMIYTRVDSVMVERLHSDGKVQAGYYAQGFRLLNALFMFAMIFSNLLFPIFSRMFARNIDVKPLLATSSKLLVGGSIMLALICYYNSEFILALIYNSGIQESNMSFQLLMFSFIGMCSSIIFGTILTAKGSMLFLNVVAAIGILVNFILNFYLIPLHGASGAAIATFLTQSLVSFTQFLYCAYKLKLQFTPLSSSLFLLFVGCIWSICFFVRAESLLVLLALISVSFVAMILFRLIDLRKLRIILKSSSEEEYMTE